MIGPRQKGMWGEYIAAAWLISQGYEVFFPQVNASCDLIALRDGKPIRVEVKAASIDPSYRLGWTVSGIDQTKFDMLLVVFPDGIISVNPLISPEGRPLGPTYGELRQQKILALRASETP